MIGQNEVPVIGGGKSVERIENPLEGSVIDLTSDEYTEKSRIKVQVKLFGKDLTVQGTVETHNYGSPVQVENQIRWQVKQLNTGRLITTSFRPGEKSPRVQAFNLINRAIGRFGQLTQPEFSAVTFEQDAGLYYPTGISAENNEGELYRVVIFDAHPRTRSKEFKLKKVGLELKVKATAISVKELTAKAITLEQEVQIKKAFGDSDS